MDGKELASLIRSTVSKTPDNDGWFTAEAFATDNGRSRYWAWKLLTAAIGAGIVACERRMTTNILGEPQSKPMYRLVKGAANGKATSKRRKTGKGHHALARQEPGSE